MSGALRRETGGRVVVYPSPAKTALVVLGSLVFVAAGGGIVFWFYPAPGSGLAGAVYALPFLLAGLASVLFFGATLLYGLKRLVLRSPSLVVGPEGVFDNASATGAGWLRWEEIREVYPYEFGGQKMLGIAVHDPEALLARQNAAKRYVMGLNLRKFTGVPVSVPQNILPMQVEDLADEIERHREAYAVPGP